MNITSQNSLADTSPYPIPKGLYAIPHDQLDLRTDTELDTIIKTPKSVTSTKNIWFFWDSGYDKVHPYAQRNIRAWHRRFSKGGWTVRVMDLEPHSPSYIGKWIDITDSRVVPQAFNEGKLNGEFAKQHYSDLVRFPLLLKYGGVYTDVGFMQIGDLDRLWNETINNADSPYEVLSYNAGGPCSYHLVNYFIAGLPGNSMWQACHDCLLKLWEGRTNTDGLHSHPLLEGIPTQGQAFTTEDNMNWDAKLTDYIIQGQAITMVMSTVDEERQWDGPAYTTERIFAPDFMVGSQLINEHTNWDGARAFELMSQRVPDLGQEESPSQKAAREIVEDCLTRSFGFKLAHGLIIQILGETLGSLWKKNPGSDNVEGTYAHWLRYGIERWNQTDLPEPEAFKRLEPVKRGSLVRL
ncbi:hypothetical protein FZEAL_5096 [Fusarium zealandicum]|uniref:Capsule polysaccharide biosynthesis protein n=1 Tax=Fusarium zealandicum TaxID=1053134 RepID=A0A8H4XK55_9HYPO|nr:hypothetical protein FZEAL_5096 [Fusarium zealandicum]